MPLFSSDVIVIGGGLVGTAVAYGLAQPGKNITVLDEGDDAFRASRGNFGLVWVQGKGYGMCPLSRWTLRSTEWPRWPPPSGRDRFDVQAQQGGAFFLSPKTN